ncbi:hypothetical protein LL668_16295 [Providencia rettgeri]|uniref:hypothetical protein n=1 Tax=Providencia rettgeri TaxID=587 RepID=UPI001E3CD2EC|nr:hypothetical protein [Providencia rettgeri]UEK58834.1 hypothetical protein LL668_16295 [Providencia rettgeri]
MDIEQKEQNTQLDWHLIAVMSILLPIIILLSIFFVFLLIPLKKKCIEKLQSKLFSNKIWEKLKLTSDSLDKQNLFWIAIITPIMYFVIIGVIAWIGTDINVNYQGFNKFLEISKLPLGVLALSPILGVIVSNVHRTIQTEKQIIASEAKNVMDIFYSHNEYITDGLRKIDETKERIVIVSPNSLYKKVYSTSSYLRGVGELNANFFRDMYSNINEVSILMQKMNFDKWDLLKNKNIESESDSVIDIMKLDTSTLKLFDEYISKILSLLEAESIVKYNIHDEYRKNYQFDFKNPHFDDEYEMAEREGNWHILQSPELISFGYTLGNIKKFMEKIIQKSRMVTILIRKFLDVFDVSSEKIIQCLNEINEVSIIIESIISIYDNKIKQVDLEVIYS